MAKYLRSLTGDIDRSLYPLFAEGVHPFSFNLVIDAYRSALERVLTNGVVKVQVRFVDRPEANGQVSDWVDVLEVSSYLDAEGYARLDADQKRLALAEKIHAALVGLARQRGWEVGPFERAYQAICANGISLGGTFAKTVISPDKRRHARLEYAYVHRIAVDVVVFAPAGGESVRVHFATLPADVDLLAATVGPMTWITNDEIEVLHKNKKDKWRVAVGERPGFSFVTERAARDDPHGLYDLGMMYLRGNLLPQDLAQARHWLERADARGYGRAKAALSELAQTSTPPARRA